MSNSILYSADYKNSENMGLFDRIINIKFTRKSGNSFTLRSDYEPVWDNGFLYFKTCQPKPEIRVQYTQYQSALINVDIFVTNLNILEGEKLNSDATMVNAGAVAVTAGAGGSTRGGAATGEEGMLNRLGDHIITAEIEMGYRGHFFNWAMYKVKDVEKDYAAFLNMEIPSEGIDIKQLAGSQSMFVQHRKCTIAVEWAANTSNPPDRITQFHGYVGTTEVGFQPFALQTADCSSEAGETAVITREDIRKGLDDEYNSIDEVLLADARAEAKTGTPFDLVLKGSKTATRNFFNGGKGFTLLEGYCFHLITRRFIKSGIQVKRNQLLEKAALEFTSAASYSVANPEQLSTIRKNVTQKIYFQQLPYYPEYFEKEKDRYGNITSLTLVNNKEEQVKNRPEEKAKFEDFEKFIETSVDNLLIEHFIGVRYTIKNLPEYRKLYLAIRETLKKSAVKGEYMTWWAAADQLSNSSLASSSDFMRATITDASGQTVRTIRRETNTVFNDIYDVRKYTLELETGKLAFKDSYFNSLLSKDWIIPVQNIEKSVPLKNSHSNEIKFRPPTKTTATGFGTLGKQISLKCFSGLLEVRDAYMFGVPVLCSTKASEVFEKANGNRDIPLQFMKDPQGQIDWICKKWGLKHYKLHNGGFYIYVTGEDSRDTGSQNFIVEQMKKPFKIPAIYDMTITPIRTIRMPFVAFLDPMTLVEWNSTATIGSMISYYYQPDKGRNFFLVIKNAIDFSTVSDFNTMELHIVDTQWVDKTEIPAAVITQTKKKKSYVKVLITKEDSMNTWRKIYESPVGQIPLPLRSEDIWKPDVNNDKNLTPDFRVPPYNFFTLMKTWNPALFEFAKEKETGWDILDGFLRVDKQANKLYGKTLTKGDNYPDIEYCMKDLDYKKQRVFLKFPLMPTEADYADMEEADDKYILVYEAGAWNMILKTEASKYLDIEVS